MNIPAISRSRSGYALIMVMVMTGAALLVLGGALAWTSNTARLTERNNQYYSTLFAAEAVTEKVMGKIISDFAAYDAATVYANLATYRTNIPSGSENSSWTNYIFSDQSRTINRLSVSNTISYADTVLAAPYAGLSARSGRYQVIANARQANSMFDVTAAVMQEVDLATIPLFQYAIFFGVLGELSNGGGTTFNIKGRVHANGDLYLCPDGTQNFFENVTSVGETYLNLRAPGNQLGLTSAGAVNFLTNHTEHVSSLTLPIGTNTAPTNIAKILDVPPSGESRTSAMGKQRYYNKADLIITITSSGIVASNQNPSTGALTVVPAAQVAYFVNTNSSFYDEREAKTVKPVNVDVARLRAWNTTNKISTSSDVKIMYIRDTRTIPSGSYSAVRMTNGTALPPSGLTVATDQPIFIQGHYNGTNSAHYGTTNTSASRPASIVADAINILSSAWTDTANSSANGQTAGDTTMNAAFLAGNVATVGVSDDGTYGGGAENFPRFHENWGTSPKKVITINGSMVLLFNSRKSMAFPGGYGAPSRNYNFDSNFLDPTKLPPGTPSAIAIIRGTWSSVAGTKSN